MEKSALNAMVVLNTGRTDKVTLINQFLDFAILELSKLHPFDEERTEADTAITTGQTQVQLPDFLHKIVELRLLVPNSPVLSYEMFLTRKREHVKDFPNVGGSSITGRPYFCAVDKNQLLFDRICDSNYTIRLTFTTQGHFDTDSSEPTVKGSDEALIASATAQLYRSVQMYEDAMAWEARYRQLTQQLVNDALRELGVNVVARPWTRKSPIFINEPWLDPFVKVNP